jgi:glycosyltransferase involved in cell wall biosynthesis
VRESITPGAACLRVVPVYNERETLQQLKARLIPVLEERVDGSFAVLFVDDGQAGLDAAAGDAVALMDADLQDPPELLEEFIKQPPLSARRGHPMDASCSGKIHAREQRFRRYPARINE